MHAVQYVLQVAQRLPFVLHCLEEIFFFLFMDGIQAE